MYFCQILIAIQLVATLFISLHQDFHGQKEKAAYGFLGAVVSVIATVVIAFIYWHAGAFSLLFPH